jgi:hypothetical protein
MWVPLANYAPDVTRLRSLPIEAVVGEESEGKLAYRAGVAFAQQLGKKPILFFGDHGGSAATQRRSLIASTRC